MKLFNRKNFSSLISPPALAFGNSRWRAGHLSSLRGFTLIELLIVIAVLGVLAAIVLVAINPAEQLARGRDSSRLQQVAGLGHAGVAYYTSQQALVLANTSWQTSLVTTKDIKVELTAISAGTTPCTVNSQGNICYAQNGTTDFFVWTGVESSLYKIKAGNGGVCAGTTVPYFIFDSNRGKAGVGCSDATPTGSVVLY